MMQKKQSIKSIKSIKRIASATRKGFTLLEMMVVVGIIAILTAVLIPTVNGYLTRSRIAAANGAAKVLFNSLQTVMQEQEFIERDAQTSHLYGSVKHGTVYLEGHPSTLQDDGFEIKNFVSTDSSGAIQTVGDDVVGPTSTSRDAHPSSLAARLNRLYSDLHKTVWAAYISDYSVWGVVAATAENSRYVGGYPAPASERGHITVNGVEYSFNSLGTTINSADVIAYATAAFS